MRRVSVPCSEKSWIRHYKPILCNTCKICSNLIDVQLVSSLVCYRKKRWLRQMYLLPGTEDLVQVSLLPLLQHEITLLHQ